MAKRAWRQIRPILRALTRHRTAALLIVLQVALTLAVVSNAMFVVGTRLLHLSRPTGTDEKNLFVVVNQWAPDLDANAIGARMRGDVATLRDLLVRLDGAGVPVAELSVRTPDLDDVFLALTGQPRRPQPAEEALR